MLSDRPIREAGEDQFERSVFAYRLSEVLCLPARSPSLVVGLEGPWGSGKSSVIAMIKNALREQKPEPLIVGFNPWLIASLDSIVEGFLVQFAAKLGADNKSENARSTAKRVLAFAKLFSPIKFVPGAEPWVTLVKNAIDGVVAVGEATEAAADFGAMDLDARKRDVQDSLARIDRPIVVIIDDVDRLPPAEVRVVFQLIKAVADFDRVAYLVAFDPSPVVNALSYDGVYDGTSYLEKVVQLTYPMPRFAFGHRRTYLEAQSRKVMKDLDITLNWADEALFQEVFANTAIVRALKTPRDITRLNNKFRMALTCLKGEVCPADLLVYCCIELCFPEVTQDVLEQPHRALVVYGQDPEVDTRDMFDVYAEAAGEPPERKRSYVDRMLAARLSNDESRRIAKSLLQFVFPKLTSGSFSGHGAIDRLHNRNAFLKLLHHCAPSFTVPMSDMTRFTGDPSQRREMLQEYIEAGMTGSLLGMLHQMPHGAVIVDPGDFCCVLMDGLKGPRTSKITEEHCRSAGEIIAEMLNKLNDASIRSKTLRSVVTKCAGISVSHSALLHLLADYGIWRSGKYTSSGDEARKTVSDSGPFTHDELYKAKDLWLDSVRQAARETDLLRGEAAFVSILYRWGQLNDNSYDEPTAFVVGKMEDPEWLRDFLRLFETDNNFRDLLTFVPDAAAMAVRIRSQLPDDEHAKSLVTELERTSKTSSSAKVSEPFPEAT